MESRQGLIQAVLEFGEVLLVRNPIRQVEIEVAGRLGVGIIPFLVDGKGEDGTIAGEDFRSAVAVMNVTVDGHRALNGLVFLQAPDGNGHVVKYAETFAVIRAGVMKTTTHINRHAVLKCELPRQNRATRAQPNGAD